jgi:hypothetical protein
MKIKPPEIVNLMHASSLEGQAVTPKKITRQMRRHAQIQINGKHVNITNYLRSAAKRLPVMFDKESKEPIDHIKNLHRIYMLKGIDGVNHYLLACRKVLIESQGGLIPYNWKRFRVKLIKAKVYLKSKFKPKS